MDTAGTSRGHEESSNDVSVDGHEESSNDVSVDGHEESSNDVSVDVNVLAKSIEEKMKSLRPSSDECCIYRVPKALRELNEKAYTPRAVSIGPYHHGKEEYRIMEGHKRRCLQEFLDGTEVKLEVLIECIEEKEARLRKCYAEDIDLIGKDFLEMMLVDAVFVLWFILTYVPGFFRSRNDRTFGNMIPYVKYDICLLENQLPFFILVDLLELCPISNLDCVSMIPLTWKFLIGVWGAWVSVDILLTLDFTNVEHFVDILRICQKPVNNQLMDFESLTIPSVTELHPANGVKFKLMPMNSGRWKIHDMKFHSDQGILEIPPWLIDDQTEILLGNIQAFEQCHWRVVGYVANYSLFMGKLVRSTKDVDMLLQNGIIKSDHHTVLNLFHNLCREGFYNNYFFFSGMVQELQTYCGTRKNKWKASLMQNYFHNPWVVISVTAAVILLILTVIQRVCSIIQVA